MRISEISVRRPVFATVLSMLLLIFGLVSLQRLSVREYPDIDRPVVSITTNYRGAAAPIIETKITQVIEDSIAGIEGILNFAPITLTLPKSVQTIGVDLAIELEQLAFAVANQLRRD